MEEEGHVVSAVVKSLNRLFRERCPYCEQHTDYRVRRHTLHAYRPYGGAIDLYGRVSSNWYDWLSAEWDNLLVTCPSCDRAKSNRFPVAAEERVAWGTKGVFLRDEQPLILNPCDSLDDPAEHLVYDNGRIVGLTERGRVTVEVLNLNRDELVVRRRALLESEQWAFEVFGALDGSIRLADFLYRGEEFGGLRRQLLAKALREASPEIQARLAREEPEAVMTLFNAREVPAKSAVRTAVRAQKSFQTSAAAYSVDSNPEDGYYLRTIVVERVELTNVRAFNDATFAFPAGESERTPWLVLLGENGTGKSTVLQALALALAGDAYRPRLGLRPDDLLRTGTEAGTVRVWLSGFPEPIVLSFRRGADAFTCSHADPKILFFGYGATRLLPRRDATEADASQATFARAGNLFDPFTPLVDAEAWLAGLDDEAFQHVAAALVSVLALANDQRVVRSDDGLRIDAAGHRSSIPQLSTGYQAVLALAIDALRVLLKYWPTPETAEGLVLIDEIGAHLHPRWQMRIVGALRSVLPRVQFLATTHSPLCLRGLEAGEVVVLHREGDDGIRIETDLPPVAGLRVDQLLTSEHFGLLSTLDPDIEDRFLMYYELLALRERTPEQEADLTRLKADLDRLRQFGTTRRERLALEAADATLAAEEAANTEAPTLSARTRDRIRAAWGAPDS